MTSGTAKLAITSTVENNDASGKTISRLWDHKIRKLATVKLQLLREPVEHGPENPQVQRQRRRTARPTPAAAHEARPKPSSHLVTRKSATFGGAAAI